MANLSAGLLSKELLTEIDSLLHPINALGRDVRELAGQLDFSWAEIQYIVDKKHPFEYLLDQWCKRKGSEASLQTLCDTLEEMQRFDVAELVKRAIEEVQCASYEKLQKLVDEESERMSNVDATGFVEIDSSANNETDSSISSETDSDKPPTVFISYFPESENHIDNIKDFVGRLRRSYRIDVKIDIYDSLQSAQSKQLYVWSNLRSCDYVMVICSPSVKLVDKIKDKSIIPKVSDKMKEAIFVINHIIKDTFQDTHRLLKRYIPILLSGCKKSHIPHILKSPTPYQIPDGYDSLVRRIYQVEEYEIETKSRKYRSKLRHLES